MQPPLSSIVEFSCTECSTWSKGSNRLTIMFGSPRTYSLTSSDGPPFCHSGMAKSILHPPALQHTITADASGSWGCGVFVSNGCLFQLQWLQSWARLHIAAKDLVAIAMAVAMWGGHNGRRPQSLYGRTTMQ